jgi:hypothetical protein
LVVSKVFTNPEKYDVRSVNLKVMAFRAIDNPILCHEYATGHKRLLEEYGVTSITSNNRSWDKDPRTFLVLARDMDSSELIGGIRIQRYSERYHLPVQAAIGFLVPEINDRIHFDHLQNGAGEMCGLWNSKKVAKMKVSWLLTRASVAICSQIGVKSLWGICADYTLPMFEDVGYRIVSDLGENGCFPYPTDQYVSHPVKMDSLTLDTTNPISEREIVKLRKKTIQKKKFIGDGFKMNVVYNLDLDIK